MRARLAMRFLWIAIMLLVVAGGVVRAQSRNGVVDGKTLDQWIKDLKSKDPGVVENAIQKITRFGPVARMDAGPELIKWVNDRGDVAVRANAAYAIALLGLDPSDVRPGVAALIRCLNDDTQRVVRFRAVLALGRLGSPADNAIPALLGALKDRSAWEVRRAAARALADVSYQPNKPPVLRVVSGLSRALADSCALVRRQALMSLARVGAPGIGHVESRAIRQDEVQMLRSLIRHDKNKGNVVWAQAVLVALRLDPKPEILMRAIGKHLASPDIDVRVQAATALGGLGKTQGDEVRPLLPKLIAMLEDAEPAANGAAAEALVQLKDMLGERDVEKIAALLHATQPQARGAAARTLGRLGDKAARYIADLVSLVQDTDTNTASAACIALADLGAPARPFAVPALNKVLVSGQDDVRPSALTALIRLNSKTAELQAPPAKNPAAR